MEWPFISTSPEPSRAEIEPHANLHHLDELRFPPGDGSGDGG